MSYNLTALKRMKKDDLIDLVEKLQKDIEDTEDAENALYLVEELRLQRERAYLGVNNADEIKELEYQLEIVG